MAKALSFIGFVLIGGLITGQQAAEVCKDEYQERCKTITLDFCKRYPAGAKHCNKTCNICTISPTTSNTSTLSNNSSTTVSSIATTTKTTTVANTIMTATGSAVDTTVSLLGTLCKHTPAVLASGVLLCLIQRQVIGLVT